jgi:hypothetical protein
VETVLIGICEELHTQTKGGEIKDICCIQRATSYEGGEGGDAEPSAARRRRGELCTETQEVGGGGMALD